MNYRTIAGYFDMVCEQQAATPKDATIELRLGYLSAMVPLREVYAVAETLRSLRVHHRDPDDDFQWYRNGVPVVGETGPTYTLRAEDVGHEVRGKEGWRSIMRKFRIHQRAAGRWLGPRETAVPEPEVRLTRICEIMPDAHGKTVDAITRDKAAAAEDVTIAFTDGSRLRIRGVWFNDGSAGTDVEWVAFASPQRDR